MTGLIEADTELTWNFDHDPYKGRKIVIRYGNAGWKWQIRQKNQFCITDFTPFSEEQEAVDDAIRWIDESPLMGYAINLRECVGAHGKSIWKWSGATPEGVPLRCDEPHPNEEAAAEAMIEFIKNREANANSKDAG